MVSHYQFAEPPICSGQVAAYLAKKEKEQAVQNERQVANPEKPTEESQVKKPRIIVKAPKKDKETVSLISLFCLW